MHLDGYDNFIEVGRGGYGVVFKAFQASLRRDVAVKVLGAGVLDGTGRQQFEGEAQALGALGGHPNIIEVHDFGFAGDGTPYLIMPFLDGGSLRERVEGMGRLGPLEALDLGIKIAGALESAHRRGIVHGDVKPDNILFSDIGEPQLCDFGIAVMHRRAHRAQPGGLTPGFSAPEVVSGAATSPSSDIYGLAVTLSACLRGALPDPNPGTGGPNDDLRRASLPEALVEALDYGMLAEPEQRARTAAEFGRVLIDVQRSLNLTPTRMHMLSSDGPAIPGGLSSPAPAPAPGSTDGGWAPIPAGARSFTPGSGGVANALGGGHTVARITPHALPEPGSANRSTLPEPKERIGRGKLTGIILGVLALLVTSLGVGWWFLLRTPPNPLDDAAGIYQRVRDPLDLQATLTERSGRAARAQALGVWWSFTDYCVDVEFRELGRCYDVAAEAVQLLTGEDPRDVFLGDELQRESVSEGIPDGYQLGQTHLDLSTPSLDLLSFVEGRPGIAFVCDSSCEDVEGPQPLDVPEPFTRLTDAVGLRQDLQALMDGPGADATVAGVWWSLTDWCHSTAFDSIGGCYDRSASFVEELVQRDPRTLFLPAGDLGRASVVEGLPAGYSLSQANLDTTPTSVQFEDLIATRPGVERPEGLVACTPDCHTVDAELQQLIDSAAAQADPAIVPSAAPVQTEDAPDAQGTEAVDGAAPTSFAGHPAPAIGDYTIALRSISKSSGQGTLDAAVRAARSTASSAGVDESRIRVFDSDSADFAEGTFGQGNPGYWGIVVTGYSDAADAEGGVSTWRRSYQDAYFRGRVTAL